MFGIVYVSTCVLKDSAKEKNLFFYSLLDSDFSLSINFLRPRNNSPKDVKIFPRKYLNKTDLLNVGIEKGFKWKISFNHF